MLSDTCEDVHERPWAVPAAQIMINKFFKIQPDREEIDWLNVEIQQLITYIQDEEMYLQQKETTIVMKDATIAHQILLQWA